MFSIIFYMQCSMCASEQRVPNVGDDVIHEEGFSFTELSKIYKKIDELTHKTFTQESLDEMADLATKLYNFNNDRKKKLKELFKETLEFYPKEMLKCCGNTEEQDYVLLGAKMQWKSDVLLVKQFFPGSTKVKSCTIS